MLESPGVVMRRNKAKSGSICDFLALVIVFFTVWTIRSAKPLLWGYRGLDVACSKSHSVANSLKSAAAYCGPLSLITFQGIPCSLKICFIRLITDVLVVDPLIRRMNGTFEK